MNLGPRGAALTKGKEVLRLVAYMPTPKDKPTIGWGHTRGVKMGDKITLAQAEAYFVADVAEAVNAINGIGAPLSQSMFDALVSFAFNCGAGAVGPDMTVGRALRAGNYLAAWRGILLWTKQDGVDLLGLARRRAAEAALFFEDDLPKGVRL